MQDSDEPLEIFDWKKETFTQRSLLAKELAPLDYLVEDLLVTPCLGVLAGRKKLGKSWMSLQLAQCVASGTPFLDRVTKQGKVLYLALEDGERRLRQRLEKHSANRKLHIRYCTWWPSINSQEGFKALADIIREESPALVVIDTLASARDKGVKENEADSMGELFNALHDLAIELNTVILIVSHHGKKPHNEPGFDIRGSSAIAGATDVNIGLYKNNDGSFAFKAEGRDILEVDLRIKFEAETTWTWQCLDDDRDLRRVEAESRILKVIEYLGEAYGPDIAKRIGTSRPTVYNHLKRMRTEKRVKYRIVKTHRGKKILYWLPKDPKATSPTQLPSKVASRSKDSSGSEQEDSRLVGDVGAESRLSKQHGYNGEDDVTDEDVVRFMEFLRCLPYGDVTDRVVSYLSSGGQN